MKISFWGGPRDGDLIKKGSKPAEEVFCEDGFSVLIEKDETGEWNPICDKEKKSEFEYLCRIILNSINYSGGEPIASFLNIVHNELGDLYIENLD